MFALIPSPNERRRERSGDERERRGFSQLREDEEIGDEERKKEKKQCRHFTHSHSGTLSLPLRLPRCKLFKIVQMAL